MGKGVIANVYKNESLIAEFFRIMKLTTTL
jgi:hypothetical protein